MIRQIKEDEVDLIDPIMTKFGQETDSSVPPNFVEWIKSSLKEGKASVYGAFADNNNLNGIGMFGNVSKRLSFVYAVRDTELEIQLVHTFFYNHSTDCPKVGTSGPWMTEVISNHLFELGFRKLWNSS